MAMRAAVIDAFGPSSALQVREVPEPEVGAGQVLIEVHAASVNPIDWKIGDGMLGDRYGNEFPMVLGFDASGVVAAAGADVVDFRIGDAVFARSTSGAGGCYAEYVAVDAGVTAHKPASLSHAEAAAMPLAALTALNGLRDCGELASRQRVLVIGASGGVGIYAVQIARNMGAHVTAACSTTNLDLVTELGAHDIIDYTREAVLGATTPYDLIYDTVGSQQYPAARQALTDQGIYMTLVPTPGIEFFTSGQTERKPGSGYFLIWTPTRADLEILAGWVEAGRLRTVIDSEFALADINEAHRRSRSLRARGKIVIRIRD
jgi:NADPH:quinone reductase-like Zn-dependent oxidoreductase